jgi:hypothetical protein
LHSAREVVNGSPVTGRDKGRLAIGVVLLAALGAGVFLASSGDHRAEGPPSDASAPAPEGDAALPEAVLAPPGYVVRNLDATRSPVLSLGLVGRSGDGFRCVFGEPRGDTAPLTPVRCAVATEDELAVPPRGLLTEPVDLAGRTYELDEDGQLLARHGDDAIVLSPLPPAPERIEVCETTGVHVVAIDGDLVHGVRETVVAFLGDDSLLGAASVETQVFTYHFACRPEEARLTWISADVEGDAPILVLRQAICDRTQCERVESRLARAGSDPMVASIAGQVLLVHTGDDGTRMRLAPITEIATARDLEVPPDPDVAVLSRSLFARGGAAIVTLRSSLGVQALRVDTTGRVVPVSDDR